MKFKILHVNYVDTSVAKKNCGKKKTYSSRNVEVSVHAHLIGEKIQSPESRILVSKWMIGLILLMGLVREAVYEDKWSVVGHVSSSRPNKNEWRNGKGYREYR